jgi:hypothetical protein
MDISEVIAAIGGQTKVPSQPEGGSDVTPLSPLGPDRVGAEEAPPNVNAAQGAGGPYLAPGAQGQASDGTVMVGGNALDSSSGPEQLQPQSGIAALAPGPARPDGGAAPAASPVGRPDHALGRDQGQALNPALKAALAPRPGPFGEPSFGKRL